jgi:FkbM family methyltransferase
MVYNERLRYIELREALHQKRDTVVYDIGASDGEFALFLSKVKSVKTIYCFEPVSHVYENLVLKSKHHSGIECFQIALGDVNGPGRMFVNDFSLSSSMLHMNPIHISEFPFTRNAHQEDVTLMTLRTAREKFNLLPPDFIKIDVQGYEDRVILGGEDIFRQASFCMIELSVVKLYENAVLMTDLNLMMRKLGFRLVSIVGKIVGKSGEILQVDGLYKNDKA